MYTSFSIATVVLRERDAIARYLFCGSEPTPPPAAEVKATAAEARTTAEGTSFRPEGLGARPHDRRPGVDAWPRKLLPIRHRAIYLPVDVAVPPVDVAFTPIQLGRLDSPGSIAALACHAMDGIRMLDIGMIPEQVVMLGRGPIPECIAGSGFVGASKPSSDAGVAIRYTMTVLRIIVPDIASDVGMVERVEVVDVDVHVIMPPVALAPDGRTDSDTRGERNHVAGDESRRRPIERRIGRILPCPVGHSWIVDRDVIDIGVDGFDRDRLRNAAGSSNVCRCWRQGNRLLWLRLLFSLRFRLGA